MRRNHSCLQPTFTRHLGLDIVAYERVDFDYAEDLLDALLPRNIRWGENPKRWVFRGQADATWELVPWAHRNGGPRFKYGIEAPYGLPQPRGLGDQEWYLTREVWAVHHFMREADRGNLQLPIADALERALFDDVKPGWPPVSAAPLVALAQHHGVPTRLLDWSERAYIAAHFAAEGAIKMLRGNKALYKSLRLAVWGFQPDPLELVNGYKIRVVRVPRGTNANLAAQEGLFTLIEDETPLDQPPFFSPPLEQVAQPGRLRCYTLPAREASELLRVLDYELVTPTQLFPGLGGVVETLKLRGLWFIDNSPRVPPYYWWKCSQCGNNSERLYLRGEHPRTAPEDKYCPSCKQITSQSTVPYR